MPQRRARHGCSHAGGDRPYPVRAVPGWPLGKSADVDALLADLEDVLTDCASALTRSAVALTSQEISHALRAVPLEHRPSVLRPLGVMIKPHKISQALCNDVRTRLGRTEQHDLRHASAALSFDAFWDILPAVFADEYDAPGRRDPLERWGPALCRLAVWSACLASVRDARIWLWASEQCWLQPDDVSDEQLNAVIDAAQSVVDATPEYRYWDLDDEPAEYEEDLDDAVGHDSSAPAVETARKAGEHDRIPVVDTTDAARPDATAALASAADLLATSLQAARPAARRVADLVGGGAPPAREDLEELLSVRESFDDLTARLAAAGAPGRAEDITAVQVAIDALAAREGDQTARVRLGGVTRLAAPPENAMLAAQLGTAQAEAAGLLSDPDWDADARACAASLSLLADLAGPADDAAARMAQVMTWSETRPELSFLALQAHQLTAPDPAAAVEPAVEPAVSTRAPNAKTRVAAQTPKPPAEAPPTPLPEAETTTATQPATEAPAPADAQTPTPAEAPANDAPVPQDTAVPREPEPPVRAAATDGPSTGATGPAATGSKPPATNTADISAARHDDERRANPAASAADPTDEHVRDAVTDLVAAQRLGLAAAVAQAAGWSPTQQASLLVAALAGVVRHQNGAVAAALSSEFDGLDPIEVAADQPSLLLTVPALLRSALVTGDPATGALLAELASRVEPNLSDVAGQVGKRALQGLLIGTQALSVLADVTEVERGMRAITATAEHVRTRPRTLRFKRATDISKTWLDVRGILGKPLSIVERNDTALLDEVVADIERLNDSSYVKSELETLDRKLQGASGKPIEGHGKQDLLNIVQEALKPLADWVQAVRSLDARDARAEHWAAGEVAEMRTAVLARSDGVIAALDELEGHSDPYVAAAAKAAGASLTATFGILGGTGTLPVREPAPALVLTAELLKVPGVAVDAAIECVTLPDGATLEQILAATGSTWDDALTAQVDAENFGAAKFLLDTVAGGQLPASDADRAALVARAPAVEQAERAIRTALLADHDLLTTTLRKARLNNEISDEQDGELASLLADARSQALTPDLAAARRTLERVVEMLPEYRAEAKARLTVRLELLQRDGRVDDTTCNRVTKLMDDGQLSTAEELIYFLEIDEDVPEVRDSRDLLRFFPAVPDALPRGITKDLVMVVNKSRGVLAGCPALDFSNLSQDFADMALDALNGWRQLSGAEASRRSNVSETDQLLPALRMIGLETGAVKKLPDLPRSTDRRFIEVAIHGVLGKALVPAFGSKVIGGRLRVLLAWGQPSAELLLSWADGDPSGEGLLIAHFGTMSAHNRRELAALTARRNPPIVVLDDAALAYLAAHGNRQMTATMNVLLPFSSVNPYLRQKRGVVAPEMFYGRDQERRSVLDPDGTQLVFGGRGLGKSALLNSAADEFHKQSTTAGERVAVYIDLKAVGIRAGSAINQEAIWDALLDILTRRDVLGTGKPGKRTSAREKVQTGVQAWLDVDARRRLLVLLDEADQFFEADMPDFLETTRLKSLGQESNSRVKVVFAGLHSVQRYAKTARNAPFGHMAQRPTVIGPLKPQHAANLLTRPLGALGFRFEDPDLVNRVLGFCSYQPFLLQIFANRLIEAMHAKRGPGALSEDQPPYVIRRADVESVEEHADLKADIRAAFHETLNLDHRYGVIAHVLAHHAHEHGLDARLSDKRLREECLSYWQAGFATLDVEGFRAYLQEMTGLGVLAPNNDGRGWHLRSANVLNMIGTREDVEAQLVSAAELSVPDEFLALESRQELADGIRSPLTAAQLDDLLGDHSNQVRVVLGSAATGVDHVAEAIRAAVETSGNRFTLPPVGNRRQFEEQLVGGTPGERRVVLDDLVGVAPNEAACCDALIAAQTRRPTEPGVTRSAVIVAGPDQMPLWKQVFSAGDSPPTADGLEAGTVTLRRYDAATLRVWSLETNMFRSEDRREQLLAVTGGWPMLVERAAHMVKGPSAVDEPEALRLLADELAKPDGAAAFVDAVGLTADADLVAAFEGVLSFVDSGSLSRADLEIAAGMAVADPATAVECLLALQLFDTAANGTFVPERLLLASWPHRA